MRPHPTAMAILAVDPGLAVGYSFRDVYGNITAGQASKWDFLDAFDPAVASYHVIVAERYIITPKTARLSAQHDALDILGVLRWWSRKHGILMVEQSASEAKSFSTDDKLVKADLWYPGSDHARDANRHMLLYLVREKYIDPAVLL